VEGPLSAAPTRVGELLGVTVRSEPYRVEAAATIAYARATNDQNPAHLDGRLAPPLFAVVPALKTMVRVKRLVTDAFTLHGEHDLVIHRPIVPGMTLTVEARLVGVRHTGGGTVLVTRGTTRRADGVPVNDQYLVNIAHGRQLAEEAGVAAPDHRLAAEVRGRPPLAQVVQALDADQTLRYADASGDRDPYTHDAEAARARGLPGPIVHGLCTMAFVGRAIVAAVAAGDSTRLRRLAVRFSQLLMMAPGQQLTTTVWAAGSGNGRAWFGCEAADAEGTVVIRNGWAEVGPVQEDGGE
jgi:acyl dehydratase